MINDFVFGCDGTVLFTLTHNECHNTPLHNDDSVMLLHILPVDTISISRLLCMYMSVCMPVAECVCVCAFVVLRVSDADLHCGAGDRHFCVHLQSPGLTT